MSQSCQKLDISYLFDHSENDFVMFLSNWEKQLSSNNLFNIKQSQKSLFCKCAPFLTTLSQKSFKVSKIPFYLNNVLRKSIEFHLMHLLVNLWQKVNSLWVITSTTLWYFKTFEFSCSKVTASKQAVSQSNESYVTYLQE